MDQITEFIRPALIAIVAALLLRFLAQTQGASLTVSWLLGASIGVAIYMALTHPAARAAGAPRPKGGAERPEGEGQA